MEPQEPPEPLRSGMDSLPNELIIKIATHLDQPPPSITKFSHEPSGGLTSSTSIPLKSFSLVCWRWRKIVLPILFNYSRVPIDDCPQWVPIDARLIENMQGQLSRLSNHEFQIYTKMRSKFKSSSVFAFDEAFDDLLVNLCRVQEEDAFLKSVPNILWLPHLPRSYANFVLFISQYELRHHIRSIVVYTERDYELRHIPTADAPLSRAVSEIWTQIFLHLNPTRVVVAAPPSTLAGLLDTQLLSSDTWAFQMRMHYIELIQPDPHTHQPPIQHQSSSCRPWDSALIHRRPWQHLSYNEGSSIPAYSTYEYHLKQTPKILYLLLLRLSRECSPCCNIRSFAFTAVFPFSTNTIATVRALQRISTLRDVAFQVAPGAENDLLSNTKRLGRAQPRDLWLEWNGNYDAITHFLGLRDFEDGGSFTSVDCAAEWEDARWDGQMWTRGGEAVGERVSQLAVEVQEYVDKLAGRGIGWKGVGVGRWVRAKEEDRVVEEEEGGAAGGDGTGQVGDGMGGAANAPAVILL